MYFLQQLIALLVLLKGTPKSNRILHWSRISITRRIFERKLHLYTLNWQSSPENWCRLYAIPVKILRYFYKNIETYWAIAFGFYLEWYNVKELPVFNRHFKNAWNNLCISHRKNPSFKAVNKSGQTTESWWSPKVLSV